MDCPAPGRIRVQHLLVTRDFMPDLSGAARRFVSLARRYPEPMSVSTIFARDSARHDSAEEYGIDRQNFGYAAASTLLSRVRWTRWLVKRCRARVHVLHCGDITVVGRVVWKAHRRVGIPYILYVSSGELRHAQAAAQRGMGRRRVRLVMGDAAGIVVTTAAVASAAQALMTELRITQPPPVAATGLGAEPTLFAPGCDSGTLRQRWGIRRAPILLTVARLAPEKGQDTCIQALALLRDEFPELRYILVGEGDDEARLRNLAADLNVMNRVGFAGAMRDDELPEAYATSTIYLDASRITPNANDDGHGIALIEAQAAALPVVTGGPATPEAQPSGNESAIILRETGATEVAQAVASLLRDADARSQLGMAGREAVETHLNWSRVARDTARFVRECVANG